MDENNPADGGMQNDARFKIGRAQQPDSVRFESAHPNFPGYFMRHRGFELFLDKHEQTPSFEGDSSFIRVPAINGDPSMVSFQSVNYPDRYIRHQGFRLKVHPPDSSPDDFCFRLTAA